MGGSHVIRGHDHVMEGSMTDLHVMTMTDVTEIFGQEVWQKFWSVTVTFFGASTIGGIFHWSIWSRPCDVLFLSDQRLQFPISRPWTKPYWSICWLISPRSGAGKPFIRSVMTWRTLVMIPRPSVHIFPPPLKHYHVLQLTVYGTIAVYRPHIEVNKFFFRYMEREAFLS